MADKQSILGRIAQLTRANINAFIDEAEDPQKMLDQMIRDYSASIREAEAAIAQTIGNLRLAEQDRTEDEAAVREWGAKATAASRKADELRAAGKAPEADRFDELAKVALKRQISFEKEVQDAGPQIAAQTEVVEKLKSGLNGMKQKLDELKTKRDQLVARAKAAEAQSRVQEAVGSISLMDPTSDLSRFEDRIRREEARVAGHAELQADSLDAQFASLEVDEVDLDVEARLAALKAGSAG
ncbi:phage shock protein A [Kineococcus xinjiangensis]|uniref:Phage shock protein A n=1 Tax=Kineococcus xinjiangensis TaxID=512762 RepID=A0A2S6IMB1_9ACTN|nr:PspA/IM30 family protein [Kineococcus xinjiangensis]PPK95377.1 phage shock protein A [Kineococcus xinjiangensis]